MCKSHFETHEILISVGHGILPRILPIAFGILVGIIESLLKARNCMDTCHRVDAMGKFMDQYVFLGIPENTVSLKSLK